ncbi:hypothetical protein [Scale drop disease virus]|uniref:ORF_086R n=1 Tax=Scale drop disease virus TaxID=1697349 RepID=A0A0K1L697_9VIRU|nr:ORF_086R [Scale drop disease virus]AKU37501.1 ORF_086R [Scale drop disease virus]QLI60760.1 hypothetical protein [Scale drop disease virus]QXJ13678.1 ORF086R [Scale drop disease virus]UNH60695.1 hypothetical protein SDDV_ORF026 [Scale drop disease virus]
MQSVNRLHVVLGHRRYDLVDKYAKGIPCVSTEICFRDGRVSSCASLFRFASETDAVRVADSTCFKCTCINHVHSMLIIWLNRGWTRALNVVAYKKRFSEKRLYYVGYAWRHVCVLPTSMFYAIYPTAHFVVCNMPKCRAKSRNKALYQATVAYLHRFWFMFRDDTLQSLALKKCSAKDFDVVKRILSSSNIDMILKFVVR